MNPLPIDSAIPDLRGAFEQHRNVILTADPGAGKTTRVPLALLDEGWLDGRRLIMLEPRRLAARRAAAYMAAQRNERVGETVGYRIRGDSMVGRKTRIEIVTEGILTRMLQDNPELPGIGLIIFDEFHERSIHADLGLALTLDVQEHLRNDLRVLIMSATLDVLPLASLLDDHAVVKSEGRMFPVATRYLERTSSDRVESLVAAGTLRALREEGVGDVLVFLPGQREIHRVGQILSEKELPPGIVVHKLFGEASPEQQQSALEVAGPGTRKVILATSIAETSITIDGVRIVIDSGLARSSRFDPRRGMSGLVTTQVSEANADQRRGRAGRQQPGVCYRLWTERQHAEIPRFPQPEIVVTDLAPLALELARWGDAEGKQLKFLNPPHPANLLQGRDLLMRVGAIDEKGRMTRHGRAMSELAVHPRLAHMLIRGKELGLGGLATQLAAILEERDLLRRSEVKDIDLASRWHALNGGAGGDQFALQRAQAQATNLRRMIGIREERGSENRLGILLALVYPERIAKRRDAHGERYQLSGGTGAVLPKGCPLAHEQYLAVGDVDGVGSEVRVFLASPIREKDLLEVFHDQVSTADEVRWDSRSEGVVARRIQRLGMIELSETNLVPSKEQLRGAMLDGIRSLGLHVLPWTKDTLSFQARSEWLRRNGLVDPSWPELSNQHLGEWLDEWLGPHLGGVTRRSHLESLNLLKILRSQFSSRQLHELDRLAPTHLTVPTGSRIPLDYSAGAHPVLAVRLQEMFGETETPAIAGGKVKVMLHLLSPAHRPLAVTQDLPSFWKNAYIGVRKDMRGQYPKHVWPENPLEAEPTRQSKRKVK